MEQIYLLGVYDHLRREGDAHIGYLHGSNYVGTCWTEPEYDLFALSAAYPALRREGSTSILLEVFEVPEEVLKCADYYEGYNPHNPHLNTFVRVEVDTPFGPCFIYEYNKIIIGKPRIVSGDWFKHKKDIKEKYLNEASHWGQD